jgi:predicted XRE-type DNA-binding protein
MRKTKRIGLERAGWTVGTADEFLELSPEEVAMVEIKLALATSLRGLRRQKRLTQLQVAEKLESSQSRVAKMEAADPTVSVDLLVRSLLALGKTRRELGNLLATEASTRHRAVAEPVARRDVTRRSR